MFVSLFSGGRNVYYFTFRCVWYFSSIVFICIVSGCCWRRRNDGGEDGVFFWIPVELLSQSEWWRQRRLHSGWRDCGRNGGRLEMITRGRRGWERYSGRRKDKRRKPAISGTSTYIWVWLEKMQLSGFKIDKHSEGRARRITKRERKRGNIPRLEERWQKLSRNLFYYLWSKRTEDKTVDRLIAERDGYKWI